MPLIEEISSSDEQQCIPASVKLGVPAQVRELEKLEVSSDDLFNLEVVKKETSEDYDDGFISDNSEKTDHSGIFHIKIKPSSPVLQKKMIVELDDSHQLPVGLGSTNSLNQDHCSESESGSFISLSCDTSENQDSDSSNEETCSNCSSLMATEVTDVCKSADETQGKSYQIFIWQKMEYLLVALHFNYHYKECISVDFSGCV
jgi:hypothetical protein